MPDSIAGVSPDTVPDTVPDTTISPKPPVSSLTITQEAAPDFQSRVQSAKTPADMLKLIDEFKKAPPAPAKPPVDDKPADGQPAEGEKTGEDLPPAGDPDQPEGGENPDADATKDDVDDGSVSPIAASKTRLRIPEGDKVGRLAAAFMQRNRDWTMEQAMDAARTQLGQSTEKSDGTKPAEKSEAPAKTVAEIEEAIEQLETEREKAISELRIEDTGKIDRDLRRLDRERTAAERRIESEKAQQAAETTARYNSEYEKSDKAAAEYYPFCTDKTSEGYKRMVEIEQTLEETKDPLFFDPNKPLIVAQMVARELKVAPKAKAAPVAKPVLKPAAPAPAGAKKNMLPAGGSTTAPPTNQNAGMNAEIQAARNPFELKQALKKHGIKLPNI